MKSICVFAGSRPGKDPIFMKKAAELGEWLAKNEKHLVYGGSFVGCMGQIAKSCLDAGGTVTGVIPKVFEHLITERPDNLEVIVTEDLFDRKRVMIEMSDAFFTFPGGIGTVDELLEVMTLNQIGLMDKPVYVYNLNNHYLWLKEKIRTFQDQGFMDAENYKLVDDFKDM